MSYPPSSTERVRQSTASDAAGRSSADMYASVPTQERLAEGSPAGHFPADDQYPMRRDQSTGSFGRDYDPYARYTDGDVSGNPSLANLTDFDAASHMGLNAFDRNGNSASYVDGDKYEHDEDRQRGDPVDAGGRRHLRKGGAAAGGGGFWSRLSSRAKRFLIIGAVVVLIVIAIAIAVPAALATRSNDNKSEAVSGNDRTSLVNAVPSGVPTGGSNVDWRTAATGGDGSTVYMEDGSSFIYNNTFGGFWNAIPFNDSAKAQADMPALDEPWDYTNNRISGVNLGGWLTIEPFIVPGLFEPFNADNDNPNSTNLAIDEWTLSEQLGDNLTAVITEHYETFITERDFAQIAGAGLNWIRIPIPFWIIETYPGEPFLANVGWNYFLKALTWARKYGLRVNLDLHAVPGSQNGYNHSSKQGSINMLSGVMGIANAQRTLNYIRTLTQFISTPQYRNLVPHFSVVNEPYAVTIGMEALQTFYLEVYNMVRGITGIGEGNGPWITFHDGFTGTPVRNVSAGGWLGFLPGMDRVALDTHPYLCFAEPNNDGISYQAAKPCSYWAEGFNVTQRDFGFYMAGEWSLAFNDCGKWLNNVGNGQRFEGTYYIPGNLTAPRFERVGDCEPWTDYTAYNQSTKDGLKLVAAGHQDAFKNWFYWTWKTGYSSQLGRIANPVWNYQLGLEQGWMPENPRTVAGACTSLVSSNGFTVPFTPYPAPTLSAWMTGGEGAGTILDVAMSSSFNVWPPTALGTTPAEFLPTYTATGDVITLSGTAPTSYPSGFSSTAGVDNGWFQPADTSSFATPVAGCSYPDPWSGAGAPVPTTVCTGGAARMRRAPSPTRPAMRSTITAKPTPA